MSGDAETVRAALEETVSNALARDAACLRAEARMLGVKDEVSMVAFEAFYAILARVADAEKALQGVRLHVDAISILARSPYPTEHAFAAGMLRIAELAALSGAVEAGVAQNSWRERAADAEKALAELWDWLGSDQRSTPLALERQVKAALSRLPEAE